MPPGGSGWWATGTSSLSTSSPDGRNRTDKALVDILKKPMASKSFSRGIETLGAEDDMAFVGNTQHTVPYMLRHADFFELPEQYYDSAFWIACTPTSPAGRSASSAARCSRMAMAVLVDYLAEILRHLRDYDVSQAYAQHFELASDISTRDRTAIQKTFAGLMKLIYPHTGGGARRDRGAR